ncbi:methyltransferase [Streptomyces sp. H10-C2]|uniref:methyltransferase n=1 Tax=unclassified Streptomyces TaxID=2593676 RepID=UPI0024BA5138|nr:MULTISPECIES: methyltransferase [unclassified Streptomyces]MDJ0345997.1 methyltransferase [Streptomyces sp. PH10-H1]MDJ0370496.1 methyltransferase [Streptomyces sp. H10-C2]
MTGPTTDQPTPAEYLPLLFGFAVYQIAGVTARLGVPDALGDGQLTAAELAAATGTHAPFLERLLRAAVSAGMLTSDEDGRFALTRLGSMYRSESPVQGAPLDAMHAAAPVWQAWGALEESVRTGRPAFDLVHGKGLFDHLRTDDELAGHFHAAMAAGSAVQLPAITGGFDFSRFKYVMDVGGGNGTHLAAILAANPGLIGSVFDTANGVLEAPAVIEVAGVADRCEIATGSFFDSVPAGPDAYLLKNILHDWNDDECVRILENCRKGLAPGGRVVVFTSVLSEGRRNEDPVEALGASIFDIEMMVVTTGRERTLTEFEELFSRAGLKLAALTALPCPFLYYGLEAVAV